MIEAQNLTKRYGVGVDPWLVRNVRGHTRPGRQRRTSGAAPRAPHDGGYDQPAHDDPPPSGLPNHGGGRGIRTLGVPFVVAAASFMAALGTGITRLIALPIVAGPGDSARRADPRGDAFLAA